LNHFKNIKAENIFIVRLSIYILIKPLTTPFTWYSLADFGLELNAARVTVDLAFNIQVICCIGRDEKGGEAKNEGSNGETLCHFYL